MVNKTTVVSVCMITYNHENFIREAIEGVLMQQTDFQLELVIGEDCSSDLTREICEEYARQYPEKIRLLPSEKNLGMMPNFIRTLEACTGKYIALCEGDDYWTDPFKLQKQVEVLGQHHEYSMCFHNAIIKNEINQTTKPFSKIKDAKVYVGSDLFGKWLIPTASVLFRNCLPSKLPDFFNIATHGDLALFFYLADFGQLYYLNDTMCVYRLNINNITISSFHGIHHNCRHIAQLESMKEFFRKKYDKGFDTRIVNYLLSNAYLMAKEGRRKESVRNLRQAFKLHKWSVLTNIKYVATSVVLWIFKR